MFSESVAKVIVVFFLRELALTFAHRVAPDSMRSEHRIWKAPPYRAAEIMAGCLGSGD